MARQPGIRITFAMRKLAAIAADSLYLANHLPTSVPPSAGNGVDPAAVDEIVGQFGERRLVGVAELAPRDGHGADERACKTAEETCRRYWYRHPRDDKRHHCAPEWRQVEDRGDDNRMRVAEAKVIQYETAHPDREYDRERPVI